ncbi:MAG: DUF6754 domain-containing protein [Planctomycetota bacterium]
MTETPPKTERPPIATGTLVLAGVTAGWVLLMLVTAGYVVTGGDEPRVVLPWGDASIDLYIDQTKIWPGLLLIAVAAAVVWNTERARRGVELKVRPIAGLEAVKEAVGRATETAKPIVFVPGIQDMNDIQTVAGLNILGRVAETAAVYEADIKVPTCRSLVMTAARETLSAAALTAGRPDAFRPEDAYYLTDEQFGYVAGVAGEMTRDEPAACFYMGAFYAESLLLAETGQSVGAIQVAGTAQPSQLPFFIAACDYTLIGEEFFAASAYLSGEPDQLGALKGQDFGKVLAVILVAAGCLIATYAAVVIPANEQPGQWPAGNYLRDNILGDAGIL